MPRQRAIVGPLLLLVLLCLGVALAHEENENGHGAHGHERMDHAHVPAPVTVVDGKNYFTFPEHRGLLYGHILALSFGWIFIMPIAVVLHVAGSRYHFPAKLLFLATYGIGAFLGLLYDGVTPDLYPNNSYRKLGWAITWILAIQSALGVLGTVVKYTLPGHLGSKEERSGFIPVLMDGAEEGEARSGFIPAPIDGAEVGEAHRSSGDSGQGTEGYSSRSLSSSTLYDDHNNLESFDLLPRALATARGQETGVFVKRLLNTSRLETFLSRRRMPFLFNSRVVGICGFGYSLVERLLVILGFVHISLGVVAGSGIFSHRAKLILAVALLRQMGSHIFNGLAHFIKGGVFFLYGIITLGRWLGAFSDLGWAWNVKPPREFGGRWRERMPSAELAESLTIFVYGCSNIFLERLAAPNGPWSHGDLEHVSIAFMFIGGGLCGILIESEAVRSLLNHPTSTYVTAPQSSYTSISPGSQIPRNHKFSYNPIPALVFFLLGRMMSNHHQASALGTTIHTQWGTLLSGFSAFRILTYVLLYISPPSSYFPSRPPTEILGSFCLLSGGLVFMASNKDTVNYLDRIGADPTFILTVIIGIAALLMSWITGLMAIKGWALRREQS